MIIYDDYNPDIFKKTDGGLTKVIVLGSTGSGKSSFCKTICSSKCSSLFHDSNKLSSYTQKTYSHQVSWFN